MDEFLRNLRKSNLLTPEQWKIVRREAAGAPVAGVREGAPPVAPDPPTPDELARSLVARSILTPWQAEMLLQGKKTFFIGKYRLLDCIGSGGMGAVFKALQGDLGRVVAIKIMSAEVVKDRRAVARFRHEVQAVAALDHPHIVAAYDAASAGGVHYLIMEYVEGHDLGRLVKQYGPLPVEWACECIRQAAQGLQYAHEKGMVHRDIKPTNLLVAREPDSGRPLVKILDLGLARFVSEAVSEAPGRERGGSDGSLTQLGQFLGTPDYISPEQAQDTRTADIRSDIFSLGCTFFRMLTGELPFAGESVVQKLEARATTDARRVRSLRQDVSPELDDIVARMLSRDPAARYQTPQAVAQSLAPFVRRIAPLPSRPREASPSEGAPRSSGEDSRLEAFFRSLAAEESPALSVSVLALQLKRIAPRYWLAAAGLAGVVAVALLLWYRLGAVEVAVVWPTDERQGAELRVNQRLVKLSASETVPISGRPGTWVLNFTREGYEPIEKNATLHRGESVELKPEWHATPRTFRQLKVRELAARTAAATSEPFSQPAAAVRSEILLFLRRFPTTQEARTARELASDLRWPLDRLDGAAVADENWILPATGGSENQTVKPVGLFGDSRLKFWNTITAIVASSDGSFLAAASLDGTVQVFDAADGRRRRIFIPPVLPTELAFSPQSPTLATAATTGPVTLWNAAAGTLIATLADTSGPVAFSGDGSLIATRAARQEIALWDAKNGELRRTMQGHSSGVLRGLVFSHNGKMLATYGSDSSVLLWDVASGQERRRFSSAEIPLFSLDDAFLAAGASNGDLILWDTRTGETQRTLDDGGYPLAFLPGRVALISKRQGRAVEWNLATGEEIRTIVDVPVLATVSPDGKWLAGGDESFGEVRLWDLQRGASRRALSTLGPVTALAFSPDSSSIVVGTREQMLQTFAVQAGAERTLADPPLGPADLGPDGEVLALRRGDRIELVDLPTGKSRRTLSGKAADLEALVFSPDGSLVAGFGGWGFLQTSLRLWESSSGRELSLAGEPLGNVRTMAFSIDSRLLACAGDSRLVTLWDLTRRKVRQTLDDFTDRVTALAFHPDVRRLAVACHDQTVVLWDLKTGAGRTLARKSGACRQLVFSGDGRLLAGTSDEHVLVWDLEREKSRAELPTGDGSPTSIAFHPAGTALAAAGTDGLLRLWNDPARGGLRDESERLIRVGPSHGMVNRVLWSPEGRHVLTVNGNGTIYVYRVVAREK